MWNSYQRMLKQCLFSTVTCRYFQEQGPPQNKPGNVSRRSSPPHQGISSIRENAGDFMFQISRVTNHYYNCRKSMSNISRITEIVRDFVVHVLVCISCSCHICAQQMNSRALNTDDFPRPEWSGRHKTQTWIYLRMITIAKIRFFIENRYFNT